MAVKLSEQFYGIADTKEKSASIWDNDEVGAWRHWAGRIAKLEAVVEAAKVCRLRFGLDAPDKQDALVMLFDALAALGD